jgi:hypothetical protein
MAIHAAAATQASAHPSSDAAAAVGSAGLTLVPLAMVSPKWGGPNSVARTGTPRKGVLGIDDETTRVNTSKHAITTCAWEA